MTQVVKVKAGKKFNYYIYDYILNLETGDYKKVYLGKGNKKLWEKHKKYIEQKRIKNFCKMCGLRLQNTVPDYLPKNMQKNVCGCNSL